MFKVRKLHALVLATLLSGIAGVASAQGAATDPAAAAAARDKVRAMTPEQKAEARAKAREKWESMSPEERSAAKKRFGEKHPRVAGRMSDKAEQAASAPK